MGRKHTGCTFGTDIRRYVGLWPGRALLVADLWRGPAKNAAVRFLIPGTWGVNDKGGFVSDGTVLSVRPLVGTLPDPGVAAYWSRFGVEEVAHRIDISPALDSGDARSAVLFTWSEDFDPSEIGDVSVLYNQLAGAIPTAGKLV